MSKGAHIQIERLPQLPLSRAFKISMESIRIRFWRSMITAGGVFLGIAFLASVLITTPLEEASQREAGVRIGTVKKTYTVKLNKGTTVMIEGNNVTVDGKPIVVKDNAIQLDGKPVTLKSLMGSGKVTYTDVVGTDKGLRSKQEKDKQQSSNRRLWLVIMSLLVCTVGISNSMLMSVTERFKEIGTMKCLGALDKFIVELFLIEAMLMGVIASVLGALIGFLAMAIAYWAKDGFAVLGCLWTLSSLAILGKSVLLGTFLTVAATAWPARQAAKMPPAAALRSEI